MRDAAARPRLNSMVQGVVPLPLVAAAFHRLTPPRPACYTSV